MRYRNKIQSVTWTSNNPVTGPQGCPIDLIKGILADFQGEVTGSDTIWTSIFRD